jgi:phospholipase A1
MIRTLLICVILSFFIPPFIFSSPENHAENGDFFERYLYGSLGVDSYKTTYVFPAAVDFKEHQDRKKVETQFQLSFKKDIIGTDLGPFDFAFGFAFTQKAFWQIYDPSSPFREINYSPEGYFNFSFRDYDGTVRWRGFKIFVMHTSNGQGDERNRSWNRFGLESPVSIKDFLFLPRIWFSFPGVGKDETEKIIPRYMGFCDLTVMFHHSKHVLSLYGRSNFNVENLTGALQADYSYPLGNRGCYIYLQYFLGYGQSLIDYDRPVNQLGLGIALSR